MAMGWRSLCLGLWGAVLLISFSTGRLNLLVRAPFHGAIVTTGVLLLGMAILDWRGRLSRSAPRRREGISWLLAALVAMAMVLIPPQPSFSDLAANRRGEPLAAEELSFVLPPLQRSLTDWVRLLVVEPDPHLYEGDPVRIQGFVLPMPDGPPQLARLLVRCCIADATPIALPVRWPQSSPPPQADQWLAIEGVMGVAIRAGQARSLVLPHRIVPIARPARPFEA
jgi:uncharacterized repeat protein (TIGR03943 family)